MLVSINGVQKKVKSDLVVVNLVSQLNLTGRFAIQINGEIIPKSIYSRLVVKENDRIEVVVAVGGG